jgi:2-polyprenyl-6-methoxyphenol hydroxylase-like FAD-dependent oxidoreductase
VRAWTHLGRTLVRGQLADVALRDTAFPHLTMLRQADVETVLSDALLQRGVEVERGVEFLDASVDGAAVRATLRTHVRAEEVTCRFVAGCDGPRPAPHRERPASAGEAGPIEKRSSSPTPNSMVT